MTRGRGNRLQLTGGDTKACHEVVDKCKQGCSPLQRDPEGLDTAIERNSNNESNIEPVDMLVPVGLGYGGIGDVRFPWIVRFVSVWLRRLCQGRWL